ncbi:preprotein translocase subunit SecE [Candidatus Saccharibacteria bacterium]|nr:preprotein translocase subunit SecE [Candidatus Saccharibacteria bacterium]
MSKNQDKTKVTRITASEATKTAPKTVKPAKSKTAKAVSKSTTPKTKRSYGILGKIGGYFKGAWFELRQVHWPTRQATWGLTGAVLLFSAFFVIFITLLDAGFKYLFEQILR